MSTVVSFAEESCWDGERFRSVRREICFVVCGFALRDAEGKSVRREFTADFGLWYDMDDEILIKILEDLESSVRWDWFVYHKKIDHSAILVYHPETGEVVASIYPRGRTKQKLSGENTGGNVVPFSKGGEYRARRLEREAKRAEKTGSEGGPEGL